MLSFPAMFLKAATALIETNQASAITIGHRLPMLASLAFWPDPETVLEANRMVMEKFEALAEGAIAASRQMTALNLQAAMGKTSLEDIPAAMMSVAVAAARPARRRARANAKRLSGN